MFTLKNMKSNLTKLGPAIVVTAIMSLSLTGIALAGVENTKHNLGSSGGDNAASDGTDQICVFCHTPHGSDTTAAVPLWNRKLGSPASYTTYDNLGTSTLDADVLAVGSVSLACLSCHDGSQALDAMINAPGSGGYNLAAPPSQGWTFSDTNQLNDGRITNIGADLQNDHPIGIRYAGDGGGSLSSVDADFNTAAYDAAKGVWWVDTEGTPNSTRNSTDMILYTRDNAGTDEPFVECASCHDPHTETTTFLRIENTGSAVCKACHNK